MTEENQTNEAPQTETIAIPEVGHMEVPLHENEQAPATTEGEVGHAETATTEAAPQSEGAEAQATEGTEQASDAPTAESVVAQAIDVTMMAVNGMVDAKVANDKLRLALENCRAYASKKPKEEWARNIMRFCAEAGVEANVLRSE